MNIKSVFATVGDVIGGLAALLGGLVTIGVMAQIVFGAGTLGFDNVFTTGGLTGLLTLLVVSAMWTNNSK